MATILVKKRDTTGAPATGDLTNSTGGAELAVNTFDKRLFSKNSGGTIVELGTNPTEIQVDNININGNTISSTDTNGNIAITPNGTGEVDISKVDIAAGEIDGTTIGANSAAAGTFSTLTASGAAVFNSRVKEKITVSATAATGTINFDTITQSVLYYTTDASGNWTLNVRGDSSNSLDSIMSTGEVLTLTFLAAQGGTAYYLSAFQVDGNAVTPEWQGGSAPTAGNTSSIDAYVLSIIKTASATFTVLGSQTQFA
jgi:hypothetical protein